MTPRPPGSSDEVYADVVVTVPSRGIDRAFTYRVPSALADRVAAGAIVKVPFRGRQLSGYVVGVQEGAPEGLDSAAIRDVIEVRGADAFLSADLQEIARWMQAFYGCVLVEAFQTLVPEPVRAALASGSRKGATGKVRVAALVEPLDEGAWKALLASLDGEAAQARRLVEVLRARGMLVPTELLALAHARREVLGRLREAGIVRWRTVAALKPPDDPIRDSRVSLGGNDPCTLNPRQQEAVDTISRLSASGKPHVVLLHGVTGSGKTEVYLRALQAVTGRARQGLVLVPEISLTPQAVDRYRRRLGDRVAVLHSALTPGERALEWWRLKEGKMCVALGARSCVFAPLPDVGLLIVDEEHEPSYKQEQSPRYHARQVAIRRAIAKNATVVLGSATPSLESYYWATQGRYTLLELPQRVEDRAMPEVEIVDLRRQKRGTQRAIGHVLRERMREALEAGGQVMLLHNRRGFASYLLCADCGHLVRCPRCDISLTYHTSPCRLMCHYCLYEQAPPSLCPGCGGYEISHFGAGTQRVEEEVLEAFPDVPMIRMDRDTTRQMADHRRILEQFARREAMILLGTQMIAKGHDFPGVTLVGVVSADMALNLPDFRAAERTFSLLTQVAGRAGRGTAHGKVVIQTYNPEHFAVQSASNQHYRGFYEAELEYRRELDYPPFNHLVNVIFTAEDAAEVERGARSMAGDLRAQMQADHATVLGPAPCALARIHRKARWHLVFKCRQVQEIMPTIRTYLREKPPAGVFVAVDADPMTML